AGADFLYRHAVQHPDRLRHLRRHPRRRPSGLARPDGGVRPAAELRAQMAGEEDKADKTEQPTQRKLDEARKKGDVPRSQEVAGWFVLGAGLLTLAAASGPAAHSASGWLRLFLEQPHLIAAEQGSARSLLASIGWRIVGSLGLVFLALVVAAIGGNLVQARPVLAYDKIQPKLSKISPVEGFKRVFGAQAWVNFLQGIAKLAIVSVACFVALWPRRNELLVLPGLDL